MSRDGKKSITISLDEELYHALKCISAENKMTMTEVISCYIEYLKKQRKKKKDMLNEHTDTEFILDKQSHKEL